MTDRQPVSDEQIEVIADLRKSSLIHEATIAGLQERVAALQPFKTALAGIPEIAITSGGWNIQDYTTSLRAGLRKSVVVEKDAQIEIYRELRAQADLSDMAVYDAFDYLLSAYDALAKTAARLQGVIGERDETIDELESRHHKRDTADHHAAVRSTAHLQSMQELQQNAARDASARDALMAEIGGLRECAFQAQKAAIEISAQLTAAQERERQLCKQIAQIESKAQETK